MNRTQLITRKGEVQQQLAQTQRKLEEARRQFQPPTVESAGSRIGLVWRWLQRGATGPRSQQAKIARLENQVASLMAEEYRLRCSIDRSE